MTFKDSFIRSCSPVCLLSPSLPFSLSICFRHFLPLVPPPPLHSLSFSLSLWPISYRLQHGACSYTPLKYTHIDLCGHLPKPHHLPYSGNPVLALSYCYLIQGKCLTLRNGQPYEMQYVCELDCKPICVSPCQLYEVPRDLCGTPCPPIARCPTCSSERSCEQHQAQSHPPASPCQPCPPLNSETVYQNPMHQPTVSKNRLIPHVWRYVELFGRFTWYENLRRPFLRVASVVNLTTNFKSVFTVVLYGSFYSAVYSLFVCDVYFCE